MRSNGLLLDQNGWSEGKYRSPLLPYFHGSCIYFLNGSQPAPPAFRACAASNAGVRGATSERRYRQGRDRLEDEPGSAIVAAMDSGATQLQKLLEESSRDDKPEPPICHPPRFHRFDPCDQGGRTAPAGLAPAPSRAYDLLHNRPRKTRGSDAANFADSDLQAPAASQ